MNVLKVIVTVSRNSEATHIFISLSRSEDNFKKMTLKAR